MSKESHQTHAKKLMVKCDLETKKYLVCLEDSSIGEFFTSHAAEKFMLGQSCAMIIRDFLGK